MFEAHRQHPVAAVTNSLQIIKDNFITLLALLFVTSGGSESLISLFGILSVFAVLLIGGVLSWLRFTYRVVDGELRIEQGVFVRKKIYLSRERIQAIDIKAGVIQRLFGLVEVEVKTAGTSSKEAKISAITKERAEALKEELRKKTSGEIGTPEQSEGTVTEAEQPEVYALSMKDQIIAASTSGSFGIALSIVGTVFSQIDQVVSEEQMLRYLEALVPASISTFMVIYIVILVILISWLLSFFGTLIRYYGFTLEVYGNELVIRQGLFERRQLTVPFNRIQAVQVKQGLMRQPFGYATLVLESAGYGEQGQQENSATFYPLIAKSRVSRFLESTLPEYTCRNVSQSPPRRALRRYLFRMTWISLAVILPVWWLFDLGPIAFLLLIPGLLLGYAQYRTAGIGTDGSLITLNFRTLGKTTAMVQRKRVQSVQVSQNPFQKRLDLANFDIHVASGSSGSNFGLRELSLPDCLRHFRWVSPAADNENSEEGSLISNR